MHMGAYLNPDLVQRAGWLCSNLGRFQLAARTLSSIAVMPVSAAYRRRIRATRNAPDPVPVPSSRTHYRISSAQAAPPVLTEYRRRYIHSVDSNAAGVPTLPDASTSLRQGQARQSMQNWSWETATQA